MRTSSNLLPGSVEGSVVPQRSLTHTTPHIDFRGKTPFIYILTQYTTMAAKTIHTWVEINRHTFHVRTKKFTKSQSNFLRLDNRILINYVENTHATGLTPELAG